MLHNETADFIGELLERDILSSSATVYLLRREFHRLEAALRGAKDDDGTFETACADILEHPVMYLGEKAKDFRISVVSLRQQATIKWRSCAHDPDAD